MISATVLENLRRTNYTTVCFFFFWWWLLAAKALLQSLGTYRTEASIIQRMNKNKKYWIVFLEMAS